MTSEFVNLKDACILTGLSESTLIRLGDKGNIQIYRTPGGHRRYKRTDLLILSLSENKEKEIKPDKEHKFIIYARVSSVKQSNDLGRQVEMLKERYQGYEVITDIASGLNFSRKGLRRILDMLLGGTKINLAVAHKDRLARFGHELIEYLIIQNGGAISYSDEETTKSKNEELAEDLLTIIQVFNCRANGRRRNKTKVGNPRVPKISNKEDKGEVVCDSKEDI